MTAPPRSLASPWTRADVHFLAAGGLVLLFTAQRLSGYMTLFLYQRLPYDTLVLLAHFFGGAGLVAVCTLGTTDTPMRLRTVPVLRALVNGGWLIGSLLVVLLWWLCVPAARPTSTLSAAVAALLVAAAIGFFFRPVDRAISALPRASLWKIALPVLLWQTYSLHWELSLNFLKDDVTLTRPAIQWTQILVDLAATSAGVAWTRHVQGRRFRPRAQPSFLDTRSGRA